MGTLFVIAILGAVAWFFVSGAYKTSVKDPETLRGVELEDAFVELKKKILVTSVYKQEKAYERLYNRLEVLLVQIVERHRHFTLDVEAKSTDLSHLFLRREHHDASGMQHYLYHARHDLNMNAQQPEVLLYLCFFLWLGGRAKGIGEIWADPDQMLKILDHLIDERSFPPAMFFKGMVLKYGTKVYGPSNHSAARRLLEAAQSHGVGAAAIELRQLSKYAQLDDIKSVHIGF